MRVWGSGMMKVEISTGLLISDLQALRHREGMGKRAFPPQGVGTPVLFLGGTQRLKQPALPKSRSPLAGKT